ncbi:MAG: hypothetical protein LBP71_02725, partial [Spirochaetaceae bacterium]|nr:hypothetical protein [Spirochaetaceae bacterium]
MMKNMKHTIIFAAIAALAALAQDPDLATPALTAAEFLVLPAAEGKLPEAQAKLRAIGLQIRSVRP